LYDLFKSCVLERRADRDPAIAARNQVHSRGADYAAQTLWLALQIHHVAFYWFHRHTAPWCASRPSPTAIDKHPGHDFSLAGFYYDLAGRAPDSQHLCRFQQFPTRGAQSCR
jgi:hypothetical protein